MKKTTKKDGFKQFVHDMWDKTDDEMDRLELKAFVDGSNQPKFKELEEDTDIGVTEVLIIGGYLALNKIHDELHKSDAEEVSKNLDKVLAGKMEFREMTPDDMPEEIIEALESLVNKVKDAKSKKRGRK